MTSFYEFLMQFVFPFQQEVCFAYCTLGCNKCHLSHSHEYIALRVNCLCADSHFTSSIPILTIYYTACIGLLTVAEHFFDHSLWKAQCDLLLSSTWHTINNLELSICPIIPWIYHTHNPTLFCYFRWRNPVSPLIKTTIHPTWDFLLSTRVVQFGAVHVDSVPLTM